MLFARVSSLSVAVPLRGTKIETGFGRCFAPLESAHPAIDGGAAASPLEGSNGDKSALQTNRYRDDVGRPPFATGWPERHLTHAPLCAKNQARTLPEPSLCGLE